MRLSDATGEIGNWDGLVCRSMDCIVDDGLGVCVSVGKRPGTPDMIIGIDGTSSSVNSFIAAAGGAPGARNGGFQQLEQTGEVEESQKIGTGKSELTEEEKGEVQKLEQRDREVRQHEQAHKSAAGRYAGSPSFEYEVGPDGQRYAVGGEVSIDVSPVDGDPQATIEKMQQVRQAANAPAQPSDQDRQIAAQAAQLEQEARSELAAQKIEGQDEDESSGESTPSIGGTNDSTPSQSIKPDSVIVKAFEQGPIDPGASATGKFIDTFA